MKEAKKETLKLIAFRIPQELYDLIKAYADKEEYTVSQIVRKSLKEFIRRMREDGRL
jgi:predicted DNA-binding protein